MSGPASVDVFYYKLMKKYKYQHVQVSCGKLSVSKYILN